ncbi:MAG: ThiF family adenylyltransferase [Clostridiales bacterium]|jgi:molybdopterin/thiamine biosynthesis adenylyltransferase/proteasome lid subunit RPN8/RPN11|nr:ThiF family adenylyltransferase [Clostridiales bacterium]
MSNIFRITQNDYSCLIEALLSMKNVEQGAALFAGHVQREGKNIFMIREVLPIPQNDMVYQHSTGRRLKASAFMKLAEKAYNQGLSLIMAHSHPGTLNTFSTTDDNNESEMMPRLLMLTDNSIPHGTLVMDSKGRMDARFWSPGKASPTPIDWINIIGRPMKNIPTTSNHSRKSNVDIFLYDRQVKMFGHDGQKLLAETPVTIIGAGGTGSVIGNQLAYLGVTNFTIMDEDLVEHSNLNRLLGASPKDISKYKADVLADTICRINPEAKVKVFKENLRADNVPFELTESQVLFLCTDSMISRAILNDISLRYLIPIIDIGVGINAKDGEVFSAGGKIYLAIPGIACLQCLKRISADALLQEQMLLDKRYKGYVHGYEIKRPSVISLNSLIASQAVTTFIDLITGCLGHQISYVKCYDMLEGDLLTMDIIKESSCRYCDSLKGMGSEGSTSMKTSSCR